MSTRRRSVPVASAGSAVLRRKDRMRISRSQEVGRTIWDPPIPNGSLGRTQPSMSAATPCRVGSTRPLQRILQIV
jgi:hypothetical protein